MTNRLDIVEYCRYCGARLALEDLKGLDDNVCLDCYTDQVNAQWNEPTARAIWLESNLPRPR